MKKPFTFKIFACFLFLSWFSAQGETVFSTGTFQLAIDRQGSITRFEDSRTGKNYFASGELAPLLSIRVANKMYLPQTADFDAVEQVLTLTFKNDIQAKIKAVSKSTHLTFELISISNPEQIELVVWGPYPTTIKKIIGETVGVVQSESFALGLQALNPRTLGGYPWQENDHMPQIDIFEQDDFSDLSTEGKRGVLYRVEAARPMDFGSSLQAFCRNRNRERVIANWDHEKYTAPPFDDGGVIGSKIALFGCPVEKTLQTIGVIEQAEGLPHPMIDGEWGKTARSASAAYLILDFGEEDIEQALAVTRKSGLRYLYHSEPFATWGHFELRKEFFPNGAASLKSCVDQAVAQGIMLGVHTLSNFITPNDTYVTPVPDARLAKVGSSVLTSAIDAEQSEIPIESPDFFNQFKNNHLRTVVVGNELIRYGTVSPAAPWKLLDCQRGAFGTEAAAHARGAAISKHADHGYKVFLTNPELSIEMAQNIAALFNQTGLRQISFDGLEGNRSTGMGNYGEILFTKTWFDHLNGEIKQHYIADASRTSHFFWHIYSRMNWGEPWYAGFRESQTEYRLKNQRYFRRNLMPAMLGWFKMTPETSIEDIEWMLARSAAFNAGYAFVTSYSTIAQNGHAEAILQLLGEWEKARMADAFSSEQQTRMEDIKNEFRLETIGARSWNLYQVYSFKFRHEKTVRQPGEPLYSSFNFENPAAGQAMEFTLTAVDTDIRQIKMELDNYREISLPVELKAGETLKYEGGNTATLFSKTWQKLGEIAIDASALTVAPGEHMLNFDCQFSGSKEAVAKLAIRFFDAAERIVDRVDE